MLALARKDLNPRGPDMAASRSPTDPMDPESNLGEPLAHCCFCDKSLSFEGQESKAMTAKEAQMVQKAHLSTVSEFLEKFHTILTLCGEHCCLPFATLTYQEEDEAQS